MKRLPPAKRNQLIGVVIATVAALGMVFFFLILPQKEQNAKLGAKIRTEQERFNSIKTSVKEADAIKDHLDDITLQLGHTEEDIASGDTYAWIYDTIRRFKSTYKVEVSSPTQASVTDMDMLPNFPYRQFKVTISGTAFYHDLGKFIADFENTFPHMRMVNLSLEPANMTGANLERLSFRLDVIALVKPNP